MQLRRTKIAILLVSFMGLSSVIISSILAQIGMAFPNASVLEVQFVYLLTMIGSLLLSILTGAYINNFSKKTVMLCAIFV